MKVFAPEADSKDITTVLDSVQEESIVSALPDRTSIVNITRWSDGSVGIHVIILFKDGEMIQESLRFSDQTFNMLVPALKKIKKKIDIIEERRKETDETLL